MLVLLLGIVIFLGGHSLSMARSTRNGLVSKFGLGGYKGAYSLVALLGLGLIIWGFALYRAQGMIILWSPPVWARHLTLSLMWLAFVALAASNPTPSRIRGWLRHPLLVAVKTWALAHLLANGDLGGVILFASFLAWAVVDRIAVKKRGDMGADRLNHFTKGDAVVLVTGTLAYVAMLWLHPYLIGVAVLMR